MYFHSKRSVIHHNDDLHNCKGKDLQILTAELGTKATTVITSILSELNL
jgi:hypothetical protein